MTLILVGTQLTCLKTTVELSKQIVTFLQDEPEVKFFFLRLQFVPSIDTTGLVALEAIYRDTKRRNCHLILSGLQPEVKQLLERTGLLEKISLENSFETTTEVICSIDPLIKGCIIPVAIDPQLEELVASRDKE